MNVLHLNKDYPTIKMGKVSRHMSKAKGKVYYRGKVYFPDSKFIDKKYLMIEFDQITSSNNIPSKPGYLIIFLD